jgi:hypothetical protein
MSNAPHSNALTDIHVFLTIRLVQALFPLYLKSLFSNV